MTALILDAGAFVAFERGDIRTIARLRVAQTERYRLRTASIVIAQVWRSAGGRQARLARLLRAVQIVDVDLELAKAAGELLGLARASDVVDASVVVVAEEGDDILTSDVRDIQVLVGASRKRIGVVAC